MNNLLCAERLSDDEVEKLELHLQTQLNGRVRDRVPAALGGRGLAVPQLVESDQPAAGVEHEIGHGSCPPVVKRTDCKNRCGSCAPTVCLP